MKTKLAISLIVPVLIVLGSAGCVTSTNSYTRDIVYRDGSYYSPADEQYGDYYYEPEPDYSYYDDNYYGFNSSYYGNTWYGNRYSSRCRFSYHHDRYCDNGWGSSFLNFNGLTIIFGNSNHYGYGYDYGNGYGYGNHDYYGGYPYYGGYSPRPRPRSNDPIPMPKPGRPSNPTPDYSFNNGPGMRVPGEPVRMPTKPGLIDQNPVERLAEPNDQETLNPYTRTREPRPNIRPETWRNNRESERNSNSEEGIIIRNGRQARPIVRENYDPRLRTKPALLIEDGAYESAEKPIRHNRRPQPYPTALDSTNNAQPASGSNNSDSAPPERVRRDNHQERPVPPIQQSERVERAERVERPVREMRQEARQEHGDGGNGVE